MLSPRLAPLTALALAACATFHASPPEPRATHHTLASTGVSLFAPTHDDRHIHTVYLDALAGYEVLDLGFAGIDVYGGITVAGASGYILQWDDAFVQQRYDTGVAAAGATFLFRVEPLRVAGFSLAGDAHGSLLFYSARFPPGGDVYDFAWRVGPTLGWQLTPRVRLELSGRWMHVSNGQGLGPFNPSYEGAGGYLGVQIGL